MNLSEISYPVFEGTKIVILKSNPKKFKEIYNVFMFAVCFWNFSYAMILILFVMLINQAYLEIACDFASIIISRIGLL